MNDDLDRIMAVMDAAFDPAWAEAWTRRQVGDSLALPSTHYALADARGGLPAPGAPAAGFTLTRHAPGEEELLLIAVRPEWRGRGVGRALLRRALDAARERGAERMFLEMRHNNPAEGLYRQMGFEPIGRRSSYYRLPDGRFLDAITFGCKL
ncbi:GNAT family N-acetyltransferase [Pelagerythrobacter marinus]|jgi:ribosomal-protein-alanine N-acetyltransferase|uniref:GNAT family N-acetyltransferase n=1 Tax=Pelagerythrobacter marinus TaxID=538382 RepID=A0ABW9UZ11_9SPHN|nr:GNAT family N-acetyltransferase [Pelagerythrobacter marinus]MXO69058.1 GNAT family N-acetyltransferase [Pelagerythrobacter marinus]USA40086.1 GNAT family N-acetyltransferase [Pelagerythrobacter marinus]WPZ05792.1 GNAT family N-acetyltransferase [Pelagerythrobacter marinus]